MLRKPCKRIPTQNCGSIDIFGNGHWKEIDYEVPEWNEDNVNPDIESCFKYKGITYFLSEFMPVELDSPFCLFNKEGEKLFDGYHSDSFFSGILIKLDENSEAIKAYTYIS
jgi:hypothetical protein